MGGGQGPYNSGFVYYFQNAKTDYAMVGAFPDNFGMFAVYSKKTRQLADVFLHNLLPDCTRLTDAFSARFLPDNKGAFLKAYRQEKKIREKAVEAKNVGKAEAYYEINFPDIETVLNQYEAGCPE